MNMPHKHVVSHSTILGLHVGHVTVIEATLIAGFGGAFVIGSLMGFFASRFVEDFSPYADQFSSQQEFQEWRNHVAGVVLLPADVNRSLQAKPFSAKAPHYAKQNLYAASLTDSSYQHQPQFTQFRQRTGLPFKSYKTFGKAQQEERRALVHTMVQWIWAPERIQDAVR